MRTCARYNNLYEIIATRYIYLLLDEMLEIHPSQDDAYMGDSLLRFYALPMKMHPDLKKPSRIKKIPSSTVVYENKIHPPLTDDIITLQDLISQTHLPRNSYFNME
jgi:hypothetical protein